MSKPDLSAVRAALSALHDPVTGVDLITSGRITGLTAANGRVGFAIEAPATNANDYASIREEAERLVAALPGVSTVTAVLTSHAGADVQTAQRPARPSRPHALREPARARMSRQALAQNAPQPATGRRLDLPGVDHIVAVASGKGGVGKSTIAANLACALAAQGKRTGLLDADIYGPSAPILMGLKGADPEIGPDKRLIPPTAFGVKVLSMGFMVDADAPMIWRGPIVMSAVTQLLRDAAWAPLDVLVVDLPPGTGDAQLTLVQRVALSGAVIVSTPQELALADVRRGVEMFRRTQTPILGVVENMSAFHDPVSGVRVAPFGEGGAQRAAEQVNARLLATLSLDPGLAAASDAGTPPGADPNSALGQTFAQMAANVWTSLATADTRPLPTIIIE